MTQQSDARTTEARGVAQIGVATAGAPEITPAMTQAGVIALEQFGQAFGPHQLVEAVYSAMVDAAVRSPTRDGSRL